MAATKKKLTQEELLNAAAAAFNRPPPIMPGTPDAEQMTHKTPPPQGEAPPPAPVPAAAPAPVRRQAPPSVVARQPAPPAAPPSPGSPAAVAANTGVPAPQAAPVAAVSDQQPASAAPEQHDVTQDNVAFDYLPQVEAIERELISRGRVAEAAEVRTRYNQLIDGQYNTLETMFRTKTMPQVHAIQRELLNFQGKQLPRELLIKARETTMQAAAQQQQLFGFLYGLWRNDSTKAMGIKYFNESDMLEPGVKVADVVVQGDQLVGLDAQGQVVRMSGGQPFQFPIADAESLYNQLFNSDRKDNMIVPEGGMVVNTQTGAVLARNPKDKNGSPSEQLSATKAAADVIATEFGAKRDPVTNMIDPDTIKDRPGYTTALAEVESLVRSGVPPMQAANQVAQQHRSKGSSSAVQGPDLRTLMGGSN